MDVWIGVMDGRKAVSMAPIFYDRIAAGPYVDNLKSDKETR